MNVIFVSRGCLKSVEIACGNIQCLPNRYIGIQQYACSLCYATVQLAKSARGNEVISNRTAYADHTASFIAHPRRMRITVISRLALSRFCYYFSNNEKINSISKRRKLITCSFSRTRTLQICIVLWSHATSCRCVITFRERK